MGVITVVLVDDHALVREGLRRAVGRAPDMEVVGEAASVREALAVAHHTKPQVMVIDIRLPDGNGIDLCRRLRTEDPQRGVVILTMYGDSDRLLNAQEAGASAFVSKDAPTRDVMNAIRAAAADPGTFTAEGLAAAISDREQARHHALTARESEVLAMLAQGLSVAGIAEQLGIGESTTKTHITSIYAKLGVTNRAQVLIEAIRLRLVPNPTDP